MIFIIIFYSVYMYIISSDILFVQLVGGGGGDDVLFCWHCGLRRSSVQLVFFAFSSQVVSLLLLMAVVGCTLRIMFLLVDFDPITQPSIQQPYIQFIHTKPSIQAFTLNEWQCVVQSTSPSSSSCGRPSPSYYCCTAMKTFCGVVSRSRVFINIIFSIDFRIQQQQ